jgi:hypothetical protein
VNTKRVYDIRELNQWGFDPSNKLIAFYDEVSSYYNIRPFFEENLIHPDFIAAWRTSESNDPKIILTLPIGLSEAHIAHELAHGLLGAKGFPSTRTPEALIQSGFAPKSWQPKWMSPHVVILLGAQVHHVAMVPLLEERKISVIDAVLPALKNSRMGLSECPDHMIHPSKLPCFIHNNAIGGYLRFIYESKGLSDSKRKQLARLFKKNGPITMELGNKLRRIIDEGDPFTTEGNTRVLHRCLKFINENDLDGKIEGFMPNIYDPWLYDLEDRYPFVLLELAPPVFV